MDQSHFRVVFSIDQASFDGWPLVATALAMIVIGTFVATRTSASNVTWARYLRYALLGAMLCFASIISGVGLYSMIRARTSGLAALRNGTAAVVEGRVSEFWPMPYSGHAHERFCVSAQCFEYSDYESSAGFHNTSSHGGPVREGLLVRVHYVGNTILRLEVAE